MSLVEAAESFFDETSKERVTVIASPENGLNTGIEKAFLDIEVSETLCEIWEGFFNRYELLSLFLEFLLRPMARPVVHLSYSGFNVGIEPQRILTKSSVLWKLAIYFWDMAC